MKLKEKLVIIPILLSLVTILLGVTVAIGWIISSEQLIRINPYFAPMQLNTAVCFIMSGLALLFIRLGKPKILFSFVLLLISGLTLIEYTFEVNLYIDELFIKAFISISDKYPGRMAPNTALSFFIYGLSTLILSVNNSRSYNQYHLIGMLVILSLGLLSIVGYFSTFTTTYGFGQSLKMAFHTGLGLIGLSVGLILCLYHSKLFNADFLIPYLISFMLLNITFLSWQAVRGHQELNLNIVLNETINTLSSSIKTYLEERAKSFERIAKRWLSYEGGTPKVVWENDVLNYVKDQPGFVAIEWVDNQYIIRWVEPKNGNEQIIGYNLYKDVHRRELINESIKANQLVLSPQIDLIQGGNGMLFVAPLKRGAKFEGAIIGVMNSQVLLEKFLDNFKFKNIDITISTSDSKILFTSKPKFLSYTEESNPRWTTTEEIELYGQILKIIINPKPQLSKEIITSTLPVLIILFGTLISIMAGILTASLLSVKKLQYNAASANEKLKGVIEGSSDYIAVLDTNYNFILFNKLYQSEVYRLLQIDLQLGMNINTLYAKMSPENVIKTEALWKKALQGKAFSVIESFNDKHHSALYYEIHFNSIKDANNKLIGASHVASNISQRVENEKKMTSYKEQLEISIQNLEEKNHELQLLKKFMTILNSYETIEQTPKLISTYFNKLIPDSRGIFYLLNNENSMEEITTWNKGSTPIKSFNITDCLALLQNHLYFVEDIHSELVCTHINQNDKPKSTACVPLYAKTNLLGLIYVEFATTPHQNTIDFLQIICEQVALVLYNIQLTNSLRTQSIHDAVTGLYNRRYIEEYLDKEIKNAKRYHRSFAVLLIDIDHFKSINDTYGHLAGDQVLCYLSEQLNKDFRDSDLIGRWGGEEFLVLLKNISSNQVYEKAEQFRNNVSKIRINLDNENIFFTLSLGVSFFSGTQSKDQIIKKADDALYQAKMTGRNKVVVNNYDQ